MRIAAAAAILFSAGLSLILYAVSANNDTDEASPTRRIPTATVIYEVTGKGTADITYQARQPHTKAVVVRGAALPWRKSVQVPLGEEPTVSIVLTDAEGPARCALAIRGAHVQSATASGRFGRATCSGVLAHSTGSARGPATGG